MIGISIIPTGLGCSFGGDAGFNTGSKLLASCCDTLILNPNHVNASDINELPENAWYTEGSTIDRMLEGRINLRPCRTQNRILMLVNKLTPEAVNTANAGRWGLGADIKLEELEVPLVMKAFIGKDGSADGKVLHWHDLIAQVRERLDFDCIALQTPIDCSKEISDAYWNRQSVINPWGKVEAMASAIASTLLNKQLVHAPTSDMEATDVYKDLVVSWAQAPEAISKTYSYCLFKGLNKAPHITHIGDPGSFGVRDIDFMVTPIGCYGRPHKACVKSGIPMIVVEENLPMVFTEIQYPTNTIFVSSYLEAAGVIMAMKRGISLVSLRGPHA